MYLTLDELKKVDYKYYCQMKMSADDVFIAVPLKNVYNIGIGYVTFGWLQKEDVPISRNTLRNEILNVCSLAKSLLIVK